MNPTSIQQTCTGKMPMSLIVILTKPPSHHAVASLLRILKYRDKAELYACGDGVYSVLAGNSVDSVIRKLLDRGGNVYVSREDVEARGITVDLLIRGVKIENAFYDLLVSSIMENESVPIVI